MLVVIMLFTSCVQNTIPTNIENNNIPTSIPTTTIPSEPSEPTEPTIPENSPTEPIEPEIPEENTPEQPLKELESDVPIKLKQLLLQMEKNGRNLLLYGNLEKNDKIVELEQLLNSYESNISLAVYSLDGLKGLIYNGNQKYFSACTIKIPWMLYLCKRIDDGMYSKDDIITYEERHYHKGSGKIRYSDFGTQYTVEDLIHLCLSISDNVAYKMLLEYIDRTDYYTYIDKLSCPSLHIPEKSIWSNNARVRDFLVIWQESYHYFATDTDGAKILKKACTNTPFNYGTKTLKGEDYSHKSGDNFGTYCAYNDAGIVWADNAYVYAIFTKSEGTEYDVQFVNQVMTIIHKLF